MYKVLFKGNVNDELQYFSKANSRSLTAYPEPINKYFNIVIFDPCVASTVSW
jgi:hypothetical protein